MQFFRFNYLSKLSRSSQIATRALARDRDQDGDMETPAAAGRWRRRGIKLVGMRSINISQHQPTGPHSAGAVRLMRIWSMLNYNPYWESGPFEPFKAISIQQPLVPYASTHFS